MMKRLNITPNTIIYIASPSISSGGPELLHQLSHALINLGLDTRIYYFDTYSLSPKPAEYNCYQTQTTFAIDDHSSNILIVPEVNTDLLQKFQYVQKIIWWLSIDNYYAIKLSKKTWIKLIGYFNKFAKILNLSYFLPSPSLSHFMHTDFLDSMKGNKVDYHLVQSHYAFQHLLSRGINIELIDYLSDFINSDYTSSQYKHALSTRKNHILYNPKKGMEFTKKLIEYSPELEWVPLINMNRNELIKLLLISKVYIDFGNHPGKDRFPREAAICGCCIITGKKGAAENDIDIPIPEDYKFHDDEKVVDQIITKIKFCLQNFSDASIDFDPYRTYIFTEKEIFKKDVKQIFGLHQKNQTP
ncbi:hypothetical protein [Sulfuricurvum sp.]|uniref:hypothetical protein n=1 Tax=Sulfuricurvum sp. TaxID=2025608 RepID=UPI002610DE1E|nr:hypothetical protein [Sulfuricurvum sp.]MDD2780910.1 hypothetical protein [Sulfuricurvum sp.]